MPIEISVQEIRLDGTTTITVSDIVADEDSGGYERTVAFYTDPVNAPNRRPLLIVKCYGEQGALKVKTPELEF